MLWIAPITGPYFVQSPRDVVLPRDFVLLSRSRVLSLIKLHREKHHLILA